MRLKVNPVQWEVVVSSNNKLELGINGGKLLHDFAMADEVAIFRQIAAVQDDVACWDLVVAEAVFGGAGDAGKVVLVRVGDDEETDFLGDGHFGYVRMVGFVGAGTCSRVLFWKSCSEYGVCWGDKML